MLHFSCFLLSSFSSDFLLEFCISSAVLCSFFLLQVDDVLITSLCCCVAFVFCASITLLHGSNVRISTGIFKRPLLLDPWNCICCFWWHHQAWSIVHIFKQWLLLVLCLQLVHYHQFWLCTFVLLTLSICGIILYVANIVVELWCCFPWWSSFVGSISFVSSVVSKKTWFCVESFLHFLTFFFVCLVQQLCLVWSHVGFGFRKPWDTWSRKRNFGHKKRDFSTYHQI